MALVVADTPGGLEGAWLLGPRGAAAGDLAPEVPERIGRTRPAAVLVGGPDAAAVVVGQHASGHAVEPQAGLVTVGQVGGAAPRDQERLGDHVGGVLGAFHPAQGVRQQWLEIARVDVSEVFGSGAHDCPCPAGRGS